MALRRMTILGQTSIIAVRGVLLPLLLAYDLSIILALPGAIRSIFYACVVKGDFFLPLFHVPAWHTVDFYLLFLLELLDRNVCKTLQASLLGRVWIWTFTDI